MTDITALTQPRVRQQDFFIRFCMWVWVWVWVCKPDINTETHANMRVGGCVRACVCRAYKY
jgi:hypothetical protein